MCLIQWSLRSDMTQFRHDPVGTTIPKNLKMLTEKHNDVKLAITVLVVFAGLRLLIIFGRK